MWPLVAWLLLYPLTVPAAELLTARAGRVQGEASPAMRYLSLGLYLVVAVLLALHAFSR